MPIKYKKLVIYVTVFVLAALGNSTQMGFLVRIIQPPDSANWRQYRFQVCFFKFRIVKTHEMFYETAFFEKITFMGKA